MNKVVKYALISIGLNMLLAAILFAPLLVLRDDPAINWLFALLFIGPVSLLIQLIAGIVYAAGETKKALGRGMLLAVGFFLLVGLSVCGPMWFS